MASPRQRYVKAKVKPTLYHDFKPGDRIVYYAVKGSRNRNHNRVGQITGTVLELRKTQVLIELDDSVRTRKRAHYHNLRKATP
jgi:hypothetical protein